MSRRRRKFDRDPDRIGRDLTEEMLGTQREIGRVMRGRGTLIAQTRDRVVSGDADREARAAEKTHAAIFHGGRRGSCDCAARYVEKAMRLRRTTVSS